MGYATVEGFVAYQGDALILKLARFVWQMHIISAMLIVTVQWHLFSWLHLIVWASWMTGLAVAQAYVAFTGTRLAQNGAPIRHWGKAFDATAILLAFGWAWLGFVLQPDDEQLRAFVGFLIAGGVVTGTGTHNVHYRMLAVTLLLIVPAQAARAMLDQPDLAGLVVASMLILFMGLMLALGWILRSFTRSGFVLQWEKSRLADQLAVQAEDLRRARIAAEEANFAKSHFLAQASHDLRQPLHGIGLLVAALPDSESDSASKSILTRVRGSLDGLARLFDSLLDVTLLDTGQTTLAVKPLALNPLLESIHDIFSLAAQDRGIDLRIVSTHSCILADATILRRIIHNLVGNALQHSGGDRIVVGIRHRSTGAFIEVWDNGRGISADQHHRIFEDFTRIDAPFDAVANDKGLGLGLAIVARLAAHHDIGMSVRSNMGQGTGFIVGPLTPSEYEQHHKEKPTSKMPSLPLGHQGHIWVVDSDRDTRAGMTALLEKWNYRHTDMPTWNGQDISSHSAPDLLITDMHLLGSQSGLNVAAEVRKVYGDNVAVIVVTADTNVATRQKVVAAGYDLLHKPVRPGQLRAAVLTALGSLSERGALTDAT